MIVDNDERHSVVNEVACTNSTSNCLHAGRNPTLDAIMVPCVRNATIKACDLAKIDSVTHTFGRVSMSSQGVDDGFRGLFSEVQPAVLRHATRNVEDNHQILGNIEHVNMRTAPSLRQLTRQNTTVML